MLIFTNIYIFYLFMEIFFILKRVSLLKHDFRKHPRAI